MPEFIRHSDHDGGGGGGRVHVYDLGGSAGTGSLSRGCPCPLPGVNHRQSVSWFQNKGILVELNELDKLDKITRARIRIHLQFHIHITAAQKTL